MSERSKKFHIRLTDRSLADLRAIRDYISQRSPENATRFLNKILDKLDILETHPDSFALAPEHSLVSYELRQLIVRPYRILYRIVGQSVEIMHVRHGARKRASRSDLD